MTRLGLDSSLESLSFAATYHELFWLSIGAALALRQTSSAVSWVTILQCLVAPKFRSCTWKSLKWSGPNGTAHERATGLSTADLRAMKSLPACLVSCNRTGGRNPRIGELSAVLPPAPPLVGNSATLKRHLKMLCEIEPKYLTSGMVTDRRGSPFVYKMNDLTVATWPSTAYILTEVWKAKHISRQFLVQMMLRQQSVKFLDGSATQQEIAAEVEKQIEWCESQRYLDYVEKHEKTDYRAADRLHFEYRLLEYIARHSRPMT